LRLVELPRALYDHFGETALCDNENMTASLDLDSYFERIGWGGETRPTIETLAGLLLAHMSSIPFENLDVLLHRPIRLDLEGIEDKLVRARRGGYCFEHTTLFAAALEKLGFQPIRHSARVVLFSPRTEASRTHMFVTVKLRDGTFVVDPGFGGPAAPFPVPLVDAGTRPTDQPTHWMVRDGDYWFMRARADDRSFDAWASTLEQDYPVDFEMANHLMATHPSSPFVNLVMMSIFKKDGRVTLMNRGFTIRRGDSSASGQLVDRAALRAFSIEHFGFDLPEVEQLRVPAIPEWG
jgi:N-hydroxyarylamine O-acetyltransferase